ncbi:MAG TPA: hypothetical protein PKN36_05800 [bacterium]|nr:hypothetical protein [bacterium]
MVKYDEYKGNPLIILMRDENDRYKMSFGLSKAKLILSHIEEIKKFIQDNDHSNNSSEKSSES